MTNRYTPQQNGIDERKNGTLVEILQLKINFKCFLEMEKIDSSFELQIIKYVVCILVIEPFYSLSLFMS